MSRSGFLFPGLFLTFALSTGVMVLAPHCQIGSLAPDFKEEEKVISEIYPNAVAGIASAGKEVYLSEGCQACHTQVVRGSDSADAERGWGVRRTVARDYILEKNAPFGATRIGPDLSNVGSEKWRNEPKGDTAGPKKRDEAWQLLHLYHPTAVSKYSVMPSYRHLFEVRKVTGAPSPDALHLPKDLAPKVEKGDTNVYEVVPTPAAKALVAYLGSLDRSHPLKEAGVAAVAQQKK